MARFELTALTWHSGWLYSYDPFKAVVEAPLDDFRGVSHHLRTRLCSQGDNVACSRSETLVIMRNDAPASLTPDLPRRIMCIMMSAAERVVAPGLTHFRMKFVIAARGVLMWLCCERKARRIKF